MARLAALAMVAGAAALIAAACGGGEDAAPRATADFAPLHPDVAPMSEAEFSAAVEEIVLQLDTEILRVRSPLDSATGIGDFQARLAQVLPAIPPLFERALAQVAALAPPQGWQDDHARFVAEHRELLRLRIRLFGALANNQDAVAASAASEIERRFAVLQAELDPRFVELTAAFFDGRRYGGAPG